MAILQASPNFVKIIVCCDGTGSSGVEENDHDKTNVWRIRQGIKDIDSNGNQQRAWYFPGIGTDRKSSSPLQIRDRWDQAFGTGLDEKIREAYKFICYNYKSRRDQIMLIGYSRGAFTVRCLADLITNVGLLTDQGFHRFAEVYDLWKKKSEKALCGLCDELAKLYYIHRNVRIQVCGVWDTVASIGAPLPSILGILPPSPNFIHSDLNPKIVKAFQGLAIHEHRHNFRPIVWKCVNDELKSSSLEQCWFAGYHADVGGGRKDEALAHISLAWMIHKLDKAGVEFKDTIFQHPPSYRGWTLGNPEPQDEDLTRQGGDPSCEDEDSTHQRRASAHRIRDSMTRRFWFHGSWIRKPRIQFWTPNKHLEMVNPPEDAVSNEGIHPSVEFFRDMRGLSLGGITRDRPASPDRNLNSEYVWSFPFAGRILPGNDTMYREHNGSTTYSVKEARLSPFEMSLLANWARKDLSGYGRTSLAEPGAPRPGTLLPMILGWLQRQELSIVADIAL
ncbi:uncharacterized protein F4822DRAFT_426522 [Hypoxylon trugodes]|uniref:uncharacterized protein n=1 Tax=Hypoxylon trugodes TaxID=326681 RepID=UPI00219EEC0F|nr:uncharacterized protein F4822DRAFT_426522 [Hypoxylon trugodes]KAI1390673.1 hypothetical protein F4822DRAFT_426522 [Hypoxylon trugodes]